MKRVIKNIFSMSVAEIANKLLQFFYTLYLAQVLLPEGFGVFNWAITVFGYYLIFVVLGFNVFGQREVAKDPKNINKYVNTIVSVRLLIAFFAYIALFFTVIIIGKPLYVQQIVWIYGLNLFAWAIYLDWVYIGIEKMWILAIRQLAIAVLNFVGIWFLVTSKEHIHIAAIIIVASTMINSLWMVIVYMKLFGRIKFDFDWKFIFKMLKSSVPIGASQLFTQLLNNFSIFLLGIVSIDREVGIFSAAFKIYAVSLLPSVVIQNAVFPILSKAKTLEEKQQRAERFAMAQYFLGTFVAVAFFTFSDFLVLDLFREAYTESLPIFRILMITTVIVYINMTFNPPLIAWGYEKSVFYVFLIGAIVSVAGNYILISMFKTQGAAYATIFSEGAVAIGVSILFFKKVKKLYLLNIFKFLIFSVVACGAGYLLHREGLHAIPSAFISLAVYIIINMLFKTVTISELKGYLAK